MDYRKLGELCGVDLWRHLGYRTDDTIGAEVTAQEYSQSVARVYATYGEPKIDHFVGGVCYTWHIKEQVLRITQHTKPRVQYIIELAEGDK